MISKRSQNQINCLSSFFFYQASLLQTPHCRGSFDALAWAWLSVASVNTIPGHRNNTQLIKLNKWDRQTGHTDRSRGQGQWEKGGTSKQHFKGFQFHKANDEGDDKTRLTRCPGEVPTLSSHFI